MSGHGPSLPFVASATALAFVMALAGCRSCGEDKGEPARATGKNPQPPMPTGMLVPVASGAPGVRSAGSAPASDGELRIMRNIKGGAWTELQRAPAGDRPDRIVFDHWRDDSKFVSLDAMTLLHEAFARALPGFDLFMPRLFAPDALARLATELDVFEKRSEGPIAATARELSALAGEMSKKGESLWVLGP